MASDKFSSQFKNAGKASLKAGADVALAPISQELADTGNKALASLPRAIESLHDTSKKQEKAVEEQAKSASDTLEETREVKRTLAERLGTINETLVVNGERAEKTGETIVTTLKRGFHIDEFQYLRDQEDNHQPGPGPGGGGPGLGAAAGAGGMMSGAMGKLANSGKMLLGLGKRILGKVALPLLAITAAMDAFEGSSKEEAQRLFNDDGIWSRFKSGYLHVISGLTLGLVSPERLKNISDPVMEFYHRTFDRINNAVGGAITDTAEAAVTELKSLVGKAFAPIKPFVDGLEKYYDDNLSAPVNKLVKSTRESMTNMLDGISKWADDTWASVKKTASDWTPQFLKDTYKDAIQTGKDVWSGAQNNNTITYDPNGNRLVNGGASPLPSTAAQTGTTPGLGNTNGLPAGIGAMTHQSESGSGGVATISTGKGDAGGKSYGRNQLSSKTGTLQDYLKNSKYGAQFSGLTPGSAEFDAKWKELASDPGFGAEQDAYIKSTHFDAANDKLSKDGLDLSGRSAGINEMMYSTANQFGAAGASSLIKSALDKAGLDSSASDAEIIKAVQQYKVDNNERLFKSSDADVRKGTLNRAKSEQEKLLAMTGQKSTGEEAVASASPVSVPGTSTASEPTTQDGSALAAMKAAYAALKPLGVEANAINPASAVDLNSSIKKPKSETEKSGMMASNNNSDTTGGGSIGLDSLPMLPIDQGMLAINLGAV